MAAELPTAQSQLHSRLASFAALSTEQAKGTRDCLRKVAKSSWKNDRLFWFFQLFLSFDIARNEVTKWVRIQKNHLTMLNSWKSLCICEIRKKLFNPCQPGVLKTRNPRIKLQDVGSKWRKRVRTFQKSNYLLCRFLRVFYVPYVPFDRSLQFLSWKGNFH